MARALALIDELDRWTAQHLLRLVLLACLFGGVAGCLAGAAGAEQRVAGALDLLSASVDASYSLSVDGCLARQEQAVELAERDKTAASVAAYRSLTERCVLVRNAFGEIRAAQLVAVEALEHDKLEVAERALSDIKRAWAELDALKGPP